MSRGVCALPTTSSMRPPARWIDAVVSVLVLLVVHAPPAEAGTGIWTTNGPYRGGVVQAGGTNVLALAIDPSNPATVYAGAGYFGAGGDGVFKSTDGGLTWGRANIGLPSITVRALVIDPHNTMILYAGGEGVFRSTDAAATWGSTVGPDVNTLSIHEPTATLFAGNNSGLFKRGLAGATWAGVSSTPIVVASLTADPNPISPPTLYATNDRGVLKSTDGGVNWTMKNAGLVNPVVNALAIDPTHTATLYAATGNFGADTGGMFKSTNGGVSWTVANTGLSSQVILCVAIDPTNPSTVYAGTYGNGVFKSVNGGMTWAPLNTGLGNLFVQVLAIDPTSPMTVYAGTQHGVYRIDQDTSITPTPTRTPVPNIDPRGTWTLDLGTQTCQTTIVTLPPTVSFTVDCPTREIPVTIALDAHTGSFSGNATDPTCSMPVVISGTFSADGSIVDGTAICPTIGIASAFSGIRIAVLATPTRPTPTAPPPTSSRTPTRTATRLAPTSTVAFTSPPLPTMTASVTSSPVSTPTPTSSPTTPVAHTGTPVPAATSTSTVGPVDRVLSLAAGSAEPGALLRVVLLLEGDGDRRAASADVEVIFDSDNLEFPGTVQEYCAIDARLAGTHEMGGQLLADNRLLLSVYPLAVPVQTLGDGLLGACLLSVRPTAVGGPTVLVLEQPRLAAVEGSAIALRGVGATALILTDTPTPTTSPTATQSATTSSTPTASAGPASTETAQPDPATPIVSRTTLTPTHSSLATVTPSVCAGDCNGDGLVGVGELVQGVRLTLGMLDIEQCRAFDRDGDGKIRIEELVAAVQAALGGC